LAKAKQIILRDSSGTTQEAKQDCRQPEMLKSPSTVHQTGENPAILSIFNWEWQLGLRHAGPQFS
jgi:hypothetical protein